MNAGREIVFIPAARPVEAGLASQHELADGLTSPSSAPVLLVWRSEPALLVSRTETRLPHFENAVADMRAAGWPVVLRKSGGGACPVGPGTVQVSMIDPVLPLTTINGRYAVLAGGCCAAIEFSPVPALLPAPTAPERTISPWRTGKLPTCRSTGSATVARFAAP
jgi:lipoate-protein ligase A